jgi:cytochrome c oxidase assembly protein subunit 15
MKSRAAYARFAWGVLCYNILVIVWGAFVRATGSGAGCGSHWPLCNGDVIPRAPEMETVIEFAHRITSGLALAAVALLVWWARRLFAAGRPPRRAAWAALALIVIEALLGAGLVLLEYTEKNASPGRAVYLSAHLVNTLLLLGAIAAAAWTSADEGRSLSLSRISGRFRLAIAAALLAGVSGAIAALGDTLYPASSLAEGVRAEFSSAAPALLRLRLAHPVVAIVCGLYLAALAVAQHRAASRALLRRASMWVAAMTLVQFVAGFINIALLAPVWMQLLHLALATVLWVALVLMTLESANAQSSNPLA